MELELDTESLLSPRSDNVAISRATATAAKHRPVLWIFAIFSLLTLPLLLYYWFYVTGSEGRFTAVQTSWNVSQADAEAFAAKNYAKHVRKKFRGKVFGNRNNLSWDDIWSRRKQAGTSPTLATGHFNIYSNDVIVFLHIQKTAGSTFERFLTRQLDLERPCDCRRGKKKCNCFRPFLSDHAFDTSSQGWSCGLHADWTELVVSNCVDNVLDRREGEKTKRRYFYTTFLRSPVERFISEFRHVNRGATWKSSLHICNGRPASPSELPMCFDPDEGWEGVSLDEFLDCPHNLAKNRQTRMLADLTLVACYNKSAMTQKERETVMLSSAKANLKTMAFFGLKEEMAKSQLLFEFAFDMEFKKDLTNLNISKSADTSVTEAQLERVKTVNSLDVELYDYAKSLFDERFYNLKKLGFIPLDFL